MKKLLMFTAVLAMLALAVAPALAQRGDNDRGDRDRDNRHHFFDRNGGGISQESEQEADSGDVDQSFNVSQTGDNSNQSAGVQGAVNTGSAQSQTTVVQSGSEAGDVEVEGGSSIEVSPEQVTQTQQEVEQAAAAADTELDSPSEQETEQAPTGAE